MPNRPVSPDAESAWSWQIKVELLDVAPVIWRRLVVPHNIPLETLHAVFQAAMGWSNSHLHEFVVGGVSYSDLDDDYDESLEQVDERGILLDEALGMDARCFDYIYDFGDDWHHIVIVEDAHIDAETPGVIHCIDGAYACPPEDVGGAFRYGEFLRAIADPQHDEHEELREWSGGQFDPCRFDLDAVNRALGQISA